MTDHASLLDGFLYHLRRDPEQIAVVDGATSLSYAALDALSDQCAQGLDAHGLLSGNTVGLVLPRSWQLVVATLAIVKSGGVVAPLDPQSPTARVQQMAQDITCQLIIGDPEAVSVDTAKTLPFDAVLAAADKGAFTAKHRDANALAFIFFTSGSTGKPKAVLVPERGVLRLGRTGYIPLTTGIRFASLSNPSFDAINFDIWAPLLTGGTCVITAQDIAGDFQALRNQLISNKIDTVFLTVALFNAIVADVPDCFAQAQTVLIGGEQISTPTVLKWYRENPDSACTIYNVYGPTECATFSLNYPIPRDEPARNAPIGYPLSGTDIRVHGATHGDIGELWITGDAVALGYLDRPEETAAAFVHEDGQIWYRTGDLVSIGTEGAVTYVSRIGRQIKVRGFRIEPGEVETTLNIHPNLTGCFVGARQSASGVLELLAYLVFNKPVLHGEFRQFMRQNLPSYMVPHHLILVDDLPINPNGKVDQAALFNRDLPYWRPRQTAQKNDLLTDQVCQLAAEILDIPDVAAQESFLDCGGDSLSALRLRHRIAKDMMLDVAVHDILNNPLVSLAAQAQRLGGQSQTQPLVIPDTSATSEQKRLWLHAQRYPKSTAYGVPLIFHLEGPVDPKRLQDAFAGLFQTHASFRTQFVETDGAVQQVITDDVRCPVTRHPTGAFNADTWQDFAVGLFTTHFDLAKGPLCQVHWLPETEDRGVLLIHAHHIILDGWSLNMVLSEVSNRYNGTAPSVPENAPNMADFASQQKQQFDQAEYTHRRQRIAALWQTLPALDQNVLPRRATDDDTAQVLCSPLGRDTSRRVQLTAQQLGLTPYQIYLAICGWAFSHMSGQSRFAIASPVSNRDAPRFADCIGMMANTALFPMNLQHDQNLHQNLTDNAGCWGDILAAQDVAFEHLVDDLAGTQHATAPHFDCMFVLENTQYDQLSLNDIKARFDLPPQVDGKAPLTAFVLPHPDEAELVVEVQNRFFSAEDAQRFVAAFQRGIASLDDLQSTLTQTTLPTGTDLIGPVRALSDQSIARRIWAQAKKTPDAIAAQLGDAAISYGTLINCARGLAADVRARIPAGTPSPIVGLYMAPSLEHIVAVTALAHLNITILPLDPSYPDALLDTIVTQAQPQLVLTCATSSSRSFGETPHLRVRLRPDTKIGPPAMATDNPLYMLFTSGSTGTPKSVNVWNDTMCNLLDWQHSDGGISGACQTQQFSKLAFDVSFQEILTTLTTGGTLHLLQPHQREDTDVLLDAMHKHRVSRIFLPFIALKMLAETAVRRKITLPDLRQVISAGEALVCTRDIRTWFDRMPDARLLNHYGPSETHVVCAHTLPTDVADWPDVAPIGKPIANVTLRRSPVDDEMWVSGETLRHSYGSNTANSASYSTDETDRLWYHTGDKVALHRNDRLVYLGREDSQVKLSGHRLDLQQVEGVLNALPQVGLSIARLTADDTLAAFVEWADAPLTLDQLNSALTARLPAYVRLHQVVPVKTWPKTPSGKIDRKALHLPDRAATASVQATNAEWHTPTQTRLAAVFAATLGRHISPRQSFFDAGATSLDLMKFRNACQVEFDTVISVADIFAHETIVKLSALLSPSDATCKTTTARHHTVDEKIAIVGMAVDLPGAPDLEAFRRMICDGTSGITYFDSKDGKVGARSELADMLGFDPAYFGISPQEATLMDPQQRHLLMGAVHVLQDAGVDPHTSQDKIGVIASSGENTYFQQMLRTADLQRLPDTFQMALHQDKDFLATKLAYRLGLTGPAMTLQAACGSSLIGVHMAAGMLRNGDCDAMLVGGCLIDITMSDGYKYRPQHIFSRDGVCRPFDADASGTIGASGWGFVMLKPLDRALVDGNRIHAILEGSAINNDGDDKMSYTAPSVTGQQAVLRAALHNSGLTAGDIDYVEAHGTGTPLGDPIEIAAVNAVYGDRQEPLMISSVKSQIGHAGAAAGVVGLIRACLSITTQMIPPNLNYRTPNPELGIEAMPIEVPATARQWQRSTGRRAGISSFGIGGTNAHAIVGQSADQASKDMPSVLPVLVLSARSTAALTRWADAIADFLEAHPNEATDMLRFLQSGTPQHSHRIGFIWRSVSEAIKNLRHMPPQDTGSGTGVTVIAPETAEAGLAAWLEGKQVNWGSIVAPAPDSFPLYPFDRTPYRFAESTTRQGASNSAENITRLPPNKWLSQSVWTPLGTPPVQTRPAALVLCQHGHTVPEDFNAVYDRTILLHPADSFQRHNDDHFDVPLTSTAFEELGTYLFSQTIPALDVINLLPADLPRTPDKAALVLAENWCLDVAACLIALAKKLPETAVRLIHVSRGASTQSGSVHCPLAGLLAGVTHVIPSEHNIDSFWIDTDDSANAWAASTWLDVSYPPGRYAVAQGQLWAAANAPLTARDTPPTPAPGSRYVVVGGTGGIGRNICLEILRHDVAAHVDIISRSGELPDVLADVADQITMHSCDLRQASILWPELAGPIDTIIFAAGTGSYAPIAHRDPAKMRLENRIKTTGLLAFEVLIARETPRKVIYCSSMAATMGGVGQLDYAATNGLVDAFAHWHNPASPGTSRMVINWDIWSQSGMATDALSTDIAHQRHLSFGLSDAEGRAIFADVLALGRPQVHVSTVSLDQAVQFYEASPPHATVQSDIAPLDMIHQALVGLLGQADISDDVPLSDIGVDSLRLIDLLENLAIAFDDVPALSDITPGTTAREMAAMLVPTPSKQPDADSLARHIAAVTGSETVDPEQTFENLGLNSLLSIDLIERLNEMFGITVSLDQLHAQQTVSGLAEVLNTPVDDPVDVPVSVHRWQTGTSRRAICLIHPVGGETAAYKTLAGHIGPEVAIFAISDPNLTAQAPCFIDLRNRAKLYLDALGRAVDLARTDLALVGWSFGAWVAQEMAVQSQKTTTPLTLLTMIDPPEPDVGARLSDYSADEIQAAFLHDLLPNLTQQNVSNRPLDSKIAPELQSHLDKIVTCCALNMASMRQHRPQNLTNTQVRIFIAAQTAQGLLVAPIDVAAHCAKWADLTECLVHIETMPADHYSIIDSPAVEQIASGLLDV